MKLSNSFVIDRPPTEVFDAFLDIEKIATCMPGSRLLGRLAEDIYEGEVKVKVGPLGAAYTGQLQLADVDRDQLRITIRAKGREQHGAGNADAYIVAQLSGQDGGTLVHIGTELNIRGKVAQFGRGVISEVTDGIMQAFAKNVEGLLAQPNTPQTPALAGPSHPSIPGQATEPTTGPLTKPSTGPTSATPSAAGEDIEFDAWQLILRPLLQHHADTIAAVAASALAAYLGARAGVRHAHRGEGRKN